MKRMYRFLSFIVFLGVLTPVGVFGAARGVGKSAIDLGTNIRTAGEMTNASCVDKYTACMDSGCLVDNESGGRCQCNNKIKDLNERFNQIRLKDYATEKMGRVGKEVIELGDMADELMESTSNNSFDDGGALIVSVDDEYGEILRSKMHDLCVAKMPECESQLMLMKNMYSQKIKSDCVAFENALNEKNQKSKEMRAGVKKAVRSAALEQYQASNKYDLGQCVTEFGKCMQTTAECGSDWSGCVGRLGVDKMYADVSNQVTVIDVNLWN